MLNHRDQPMRILGAYFRKEIEACYSKHARVNTMLTNLHVASVGWGFWFIYKCLHVNDCGRDDSCCWNFTSLFDRAASKQFNLPFVKTCHTMVCQRHGISASLRGLRSG